MAGDSTTRVVVAAISGNAMITVVKFVGWFFAPSPSLLAESIHSVADTCNQILLFVGIRVSRKAPCTGTSPSS